MAMKFETLLQDRSRWTTDLCSGAKTLDLLSTKSAFLVVRECFYGTKRFEDFVTRTGSTAPTVSRVLKQLEAAGIVDRVPYQEPGSRMRDEYALTRAGEDLLPILLALIQWGDTYLQPDGAPLSFVEAETGLPVRVRVTTPEAEVALSDHIDIKANRAYLRRQARAERAAATDAD